MVNTTEEIDRPKAGAEQRPATGVPSLAEDGEDLPAFLIFAIGIAVLVAVVIPLSVGGSGDDDASAGVPSEDHAEVVDDEHEADEAEEVAADDGHDLDGLVEAAVADTGVAADVSGSTVTLTGEVADEAARGSIISAVEGIEGVESVVDEMTIAPAASTGTVELAASQAALMLSGTVPTQAMSDDLEARARTVYSADQIDNQLVVDDGVEPPLGISVTGNLTDEALFNALGLAFADVEGAEDIDFSGFELAESAEFETQLNSLSAIQFASGSAQILPESAEILDQAAEILNSDPSIVIEIGGHTDSVGSSESNQKLSEDRAKAVDAALTERGVTNETSPRGYGEQRLAKNPESTDEDRATNRRIEFRII